MRVSVMIMAALLAGCAKHQEQFSADPPSLHVGEVALTAGEPTIALSVANERLSLTPNEPNALLLRANAEFAMGQPGAAAADFKQVLVLHPASADAALGLARIITPTDPAAAETLLGAVVARGNPTAAIWNNLGVARDLLGRHAEAQQAYAKALQLDPDMIGAQANLARSLSLTPTER